MTETAPSPDTAPAARRFAFLVHPRAQVATDMARIWRPLGLIPDSAWGWGLRNLPVPPITLANVHRADTDAGPAGSVIVVPVGARQMLAENRRWVVGRIEAAIDRAEALGAEIVGLGALTAPASGAGRMLRERPGIAMTTGNAFTAYLTVEAIRRLLPAARGGHIAIIGATGSVGTCVVRLLADEPIGTDLTLIARNERRLDILAAEFAERGTGVSVRATTSMDAVRDADLVVVLTSATDAVLRSEHLRPGAIVLDDTQPRNTDPALMTERPDVLVVDGGVAAVPGIRIRGDIGLPRGLAYACLCETMLMAFSGNAADAVDAVGQASVDHALRMRDAARRFAHLGFTLADPLSFGRPTHWPDAVAVEQAA
ncbi:semialdehyde dehydrogenase [Microbacterium lacus]|uniref:semialdehyde dehydrogenase n=1 Tax=Microbacterium lacus TaxID=415217 RepID=UPI0038502788